MNQDRKLIVVVICQSELVLKGFAEILKNCIADEIITILKSEELIDYPNLKGQVLIIATEEVQTKSGSFIRKILNSAENVGFLTFHYSDDADYLNPDIYLSDSGVMLCYKTDVALKVFNSIQNGENDTELTKREIDVLRLITKGFSNKEIADHLFVSIHTVISHRKNISEKTGIKSASGLTMYSILKRIIDVTEINPEELI